MTESCGDKLSDHVWVRLDPDKVTAAYLVTDDGQEVEVPVPEVGMPTHQCERCGKVALPRL